jgi:ribosome-associated heat shock protein Hsp15
MVDRSDAPAASAARLRIDKWLWAARFYRTRTLAANAIEAGHVRVNGERVKPAQPVAAGSTVEVRRGGLAWIVEVTAIAERRGSAKDAALLYRETAESAAAREKAVAERRATSAAPGRPTKRDRRKLEDFLNEP